MELACPPPPPFMRASAAQARHEFDVRPSLPASRKVEVETFEGEPIDVELPSSVSGQHVVNFSVWVDMSKRDRGRAGTASIRAELTLPVHLRYPDPACERRGEDCEGYAWVEVSKHQANAPHALTRSERCCLARGLFWLTGGTLGHNRHAWFHA